MARKQRNVGSIQDVAVRVKLWRCCVAPLGEKVEIPTAHSRMPLVVPDLVFHLVFNADLKERLSFPSMLNLSMLEDQGHFQAVRCSVWIFWYYLKRVGTILLLDHLPRDRKSSLRNRFLPVTVIGAVATSTWRLETTRPRQVLYRSRYRLLVKLAGGGMGGTAAVVKKMMRVSWTVHGTSFGKMTL